jgi:Ca2+-transporting ATPase
LPDTRQRWHVLETGATGEALGTHLEKGLTAVEAEARLEQHGPNTLPEEEQQTLVGMFVGQFKDFLVLILVAAAAVSVALGEWTDAGAIGAILILNAVLGAAQERRAGRALEALKRLSVPECEVIRDGATVMVSSEALVPGDVVVLREGAFVPADLRLAEAHNLRVDEASLTGESAPVTKTTDPLDDHAPLADRTCMAYAGTVVTYGRGQGLVVATGIQREIGRIAELLKQQPETTTPLQKRLAGFGKLLGILTLAICGLTFVLGVARGLPLWEMFMTAVSLAVAAIPEGLPAIVTVVLALGVYRMSRHRAIVRKLPAVETLGCATYICTDKTGTLTENRMAVTTVWTPDAAEAPAGAEPSPARTRVVRIAALCNDAHLEMADGERRSFGDPTELALVEFAEAEGIDVSALRARHERLGEVPFNSDRKRMSTLHQMEGSRRLLVKGAPGVILQRCTQQGRDGGTDPFGEADRDAVRAAVEAMADRALRVLAYAWKDVGETREVGEDDESDLVFAGLTGMRDAPRRQAQPALQEAKAAGLHTIMVTGDNLRTARAIAEDLRMIEPGDSCVTGRDLAELTDADLADRVRHIRVFARVWPEQKLRIVQALQSGGEVVAMTGDGVNDAPALQKADIGVAMGITGTDVAKGAADVVLTDDNFATIVEAIAEGRVIFDNIRKFITYLLACNLGEILAVLVPVLIALGTPLVPVQILLINLVTDGLPALALGVDAAEPDIMKRRPRRAREGIINRHYMLIILVNALFIATAVVLAFWIGSRTGNLDVARTMAFVTLGCSELLRAYSSRSERRSFWQMNPMTNLYLVGACLLSAGIVLVAVLTPLRSVCGNATLTATQWAIALGLCLIPFVAYEIWKVVQRALRSKA